MMADMQQKRIYIQAAEQISIQQPLSLQWMEFPLFYDEPFVKAVNPVFHDFIAANVVRRMGNIMKRALVTSLKVMGDTDTPHPDAIITGTCLGSLDYTERFLDALSENGEEMLSPTYFMQSTHNTVGATLGIHTQTHGYNTTYSHGSVSFDWAVLDAWIQMQLGQVSTALVGGHDEMVEPYFKLLQKTGYVGKEGMVPCSETAVSMMLSTTSHPNDLCELVGISISHTCSTNLLKKQLDQLLFKAGLKVEDISAVMTGVNGNPTNDQRYYDLIDYLLPHAPLLHYKHLFGENFTVSALGFYAAAHCLAQSYIPSFVYDSVKSYRCETPQIILLVNMTDSQDVSLIILMKP